MIMAELQQMIDKKIRHEVHTFDLTALERKAVIRFLFVSEGQVHGLRDV